jgi:hypothetical protein
MSGIPGGRRRRLVDEKLNDTASTVDTCYPCTGLQRSARRGQSCETGFSYASATTA